MSVQLIERNGKPEWAILPYEDYLKLVEQAELFEDIQDYDRIKSAVDSGDEEILPSEVVDALIDGKNPIKVWREYRKLTQSELAEKVNISVPYLSQIETGKRKASTRVLAAIASVLQVEVDDLISKDEPLVTMR